MMPSLKPGLTHKLFYKVPENRTVPYLCPESAQFSSMPKVFATGYMVGLFEWACIELMKNHLEPGEGSLGIHVDFSHLAATPPGLTITVEAECTGVDGRRLSFKVRGACVLCPRSEAPQLSCIHSKCTGSIEFSWH